jgi:hypothetical protein
MDTPTLSSRGPKRRKTSPSKSVPPEANTTPRASFLSPTRASLSRFNPSLLPRPTSAGAVSARRARQNAPQTPDLNNQFLATGQDALKFIMGEVGSAMQNVLSAARQQPQNPMIPAVLTGDETDEQMAAIRAANRARRQSEKQQEQEEERQHRASERRSMAPIERARGESEDGFDAPEMESALPDLDEDDLPDTPEQLRRQLEIDDTPPRGLLFSSPSKRRKRRTNLREKILSSPAKRLEETRPPDSQPARKQPVLEQLPDIDQLPETERQVEPPPEKDAETIAKEAEKQKLQKELKTLQDEVQQYTRHIEQLDDEESDDIGELVQLINSSRPGGLLPIQEPAPLSSLLTSFLPFSIPLKQPEPSLDQEKPILSHFPIQQTDPLPLLTLFTPLKITSTISPPSTPSSPSDSIKQTHNITLSGPASLLSCKLDFTVSSISFEPEIPSVDSLSLSNLSYWASQEISLYLQKCADEGDINAIGYALGRYWDISVKRAQCWSRCSKEFRHLATLSEGVRDTAIEEEEVSTLEPPVFRKAELLPHLGRQFLVFQNEDVVLKVEWKLEFDWTGEVKSVISAKAALPQVCKFLSVILL